MNQVLGRLYASENAANNVALKNTIVRTASNHGTRRGMGLVYLQGDLAEVHPALHSALSLRRLVQGEGAVDHVRQPPGRDQVHDRMEVFDWAHSGTDNGNVTIEDVAIVDHDLRPSAASHRKQSAAFAQEPEARHER